MLEVAQRMSLKCPTSFEASIFLFNNPALIACRMATAFVSALPGLAPAPKTHIGSSIMVTDDTRKT